MSAIKVQYLADGFELSNFQFHEWDSHLACMTPVGVEPLKGQISSCNLQEGVWSLSPSDMQYPRRQLAKYQQFVIAIFFLKAFCKYGITDLGKI